MANVEGRRTIWIAALVVVLAFAGGIVAGIIGDRMYLMTHERIVPRGGIEFLARHLIRRLDRSLDLSDEQESQIRAIIDRRAGRIAALERNVHATIHAEFTATHAEIAKILTPQQRQKFERMQRRWHGRHHE